MRRLHLFLATNAGLGFSPVAPGTVGTLAGIPAYYLLAPLPPLLFLLTWLGLFALASWSAAAAGRIWGVVDDRRIVIDELVGYLATVAFLPFDWRAALVGFVLFRLFDVVKVPPANWIDRRMKNGFGVVLDDVVAGLYGAAALRLLLWMVGP